MVAECAFGHTVTRLKEMMGKVSNKLYPDFLLSEILIKDVLLLNSKTKDYKINEFEGMLFVEDNIKWISLVKNNGAKTK